jgi:endonuclease/exonuclease/phosphatase family metal-dependent hydrolase
LCREATSQRLFSVPTQRLRLVTFNIAHGRGLTPIQGLTSLRKLRLNLRRIADLLSKLGADVVALQEIDECSVWSGSFDHLDYLRAHAGFPHAAFGINNRRAGLVNLCYGNAILSRFPIDATETIAFGQRRVGEKGFLFAEINVGGRIVPIVNLHLHFSSRRKRLVQLDHLVTWLRGKERERGGGWSIPPIVCGDFNNPDTRDDATAALLSHLGDYGDYALHPLMGRTFPSPLPRRALDFVFIPPGCRLVHSEVVRSFLSDHRPVMVEFSVA